MSDLHDPHAVTQHGDEITRRNVMPKRAFLMVALQPGLKARLMCASCLKSFVSTIWKVDSVPRDRSTA